MVAHLDSKSQVSNALLQSKTQNLKSKIVCALCGLPAQRHITDTIDSQDLPFCCYGCRHIYQIVAPDLAQGIDLHQAMGRGRTGP